MVKNNNKVKIPALRVRQWLPSWDEIQWNPAENRRKPPGCFYQFSMAATDLRRLSGVYARTTDRVTAAEDFGIQRQLNRARSDEISRFVEYGYPWSDLSNSKRRSSDFRDLRQPGWLPTSLVVNLLRSEDSRGGKTIADSDLISVEDSGSGPATLLLPKDFNKENWKPTSLAPIEVIDGQHRLWAFDEFDSYEEFELPVVAFVGLDLSWQAYLFYTINIKPKKINASLAFDLYPLLRTEQWLEKFEGHAIYRETRSQELVDKLWSHPESPWHHRINMLGDAGHRGLMVSQAAWVRSLLASFVKSWEGRQDRIGGIFGAKVGSHQLVLSWNFSEQAAFLIFVGIKIRNAIRNVEAAWAVSMREQGDAGQPDLAFYGPNNLLNQDQGVRTLLQVVNDLFFLNADFLLRHHWARRETEMNSNGIDSEITSALASLNEDSEICLFMDEVASVLASYDWRASSFPNLGTDQQSLKASFRGSGGYKELRTHVLNHIASGDGHLASDAKLIINTLGYDFTL